MEILKRKVAEIEGKKIVLMPNVPKNVCVNRFGGTHREFQIDDKRVEVCILVEEEDAEGRKFKPLENVEIDETFIKYKLAEE